VAESRLDNHQQLLENNIELTARIVDRLDTHIQDSNRRELEMSNNLVRVTEAVTHLSATVGETNSTLAKMARMAEGHSTTIGQWRAGWRALVTAATVAGMVVSAGWAVYTYQPPATVASQPHSNGNSATVTMEKKR
jgi:hypothetical protein